MPAETVPAETVPAPVGGLAGRVARQLLSAGRSGDATTTPHLLCTGELPLDVIIGQTLMPGVEWNRLDSLSFDVQTGRIGGWVVMGTPNAQVSTLIADLRALAPMPPLVAVDEEGGRVQRLRNVLTRLPSAEQQVATNTPEQLAALFEDHARDMATLGFDMDFAPVLDVGGGPGIGDRAFGSEPAVVTEYGSAVLDGLERGGIVGVIKHFPGHGRASADSHFGLPITPSIDELGAVDLAPFRAAIDAGATAVMVGHLDVPGLTNGVPTSLSPEAIIGLLRGELGFDGLVLTDSLDMGAVVERWSTPEAVELALAAGNDIALLGNANEIEAIHLHLLDAVDQGRITNGRLVEAAARVLSAKSLFACSL